MKKKLLFTIIFLYFFYWFLLSFFYYFGFFKISSFITKIYFLPKTSYHLYVDGNIFSELYFKYGKDIYYEKAIASYNNSLEKKVFFESQNNKNYLENLKKINNQENKSNENSGNGENNGENFKPVEFEETEVNEINDFIKQIQNNSNEIFFEF